MLRKRYQSLADNKPNNATIISNDTCTQLINPIIDTNTAYVDIAKQSQSYWEPIPMAKGLADLQFTTTTNMYAEALVSSLGTGITDTVYLDITNQPEPNYFSIPAMGISSVTTTSLTATPVVYDSLQFSPNTYAENIPGYITGQSQPPDKKLTDCTSDTDDDYML